VNALAAWQLRNPTREGRQYPPEAVVFPYAFIWRLMLLGDGRLNSEEMKCEVLRLENRAQIDEAAKRIHEYRHSGDVGRMQPPITVDKDDRLISWMSLASFGWALVQKKDDDGYWRIRPQVRRIVERAAEIEHRHHTLESWASEEAYFEHIARAAAIPEDLR
jgi:hypothetical protein